MMTAQSGPTYSPTNVNLARGAYAILQRRSRRYDEFSSVIFEETAWEMLLELYVRYHTGSSSTVAQLQRTSGNAPSTASRWLGHLEKQGLVVRQAHPVDSTTAFVELTDAAREALDRYLKSILKL